MAPIRRTETNRPWAHRLIKKNQDIQRIAISSFRRGKKAEIVGEYSSFAEYASEPKGLQMGIIIQFVAAATRRLDDR
jgi:hypothetical protein